MNIDRLIASATAQSGATLRVILDASELTETTNATAQVIPLFDAPANSLVELIAVHSITGFSDESNASFSSTALTVGYTSATSGLLASTQLNSNSGSVVTAAVGSGPVALSSETTINATVASMTGMALADIDQGEILLLFRVVELARFTG